MCGMNFYQITRTQRGSGGFLQRCADRRFDRCEIGAFHKRRIADDNAHGGFIFEHRFNTQRSTGEIDEHQYTVIAGDAVQSVANSLRADPERAINRSADCDNRNLTVRRLIGEFLDATGKLLTMRNN